MPFRVPLPGILESEALGALLERQSGLRWFGVVKEEGGPPYQVLALGWAQFAAKPDHLTLCRAKAVFQNVLQIKPISTKAGIMKEKTPIPNHDG